MDYDLNTFPLQPPKSTELRLAHFDETVFKADPATFVYKFVDAVVGDGGAGSLLKDSLMTDSVLPWRPCTSPTWTTSSGVCTSWSDQMLSPTPTTHKVNSSHLTSGMR